MVYFGVFWCKCFPIVSPMFPQCFPNLQKWGNI